MAAYLLSDADSRKSERRDENMGYIPERRVNRFVTIVSILITVVLLFVAILALYYIRNPTTKLIMVGVFMLLFAAGIGLFTTAKRSEVFAATAA
jgi:magnesium-transporting ATPase (P-type)